MKFGPEPELIESPLSRTLEQAGVRLTINIVRLATERGWSLEVVNEHGTSTVWDTPFATDREADAAFREALIQEGIEAFLGK
ncbi:hypothetical protein CG471_18540 [Sphingobium sp. IP1]|jgi:uncharacterized protein|uniref:hypothetical protein n=1 Tax=Sphingobium TaxID=165695 RepID=UPI000C087429|nr:MULTISPECIES: hypothetical protein [Sphingobium]PHP18256.1 hypothetical protein CG471_18540 [Sphingobium sp. IP1]WRD77229.1 hypothetical protein QQ987_03560 [Sphingobium baderi]